MDEQHERGMEFDPSEMLRVLSEMKQLMLYDPAKLAALSQEAVAFAAEETGRSPANVADIVAALDLETASDEEQQIFRTYFARMASAF